MTDKSKNPWAEVWDSMCAIGTRLVALEKKTPGISMRVGPARPLATSERSETWREIEINGQVFRVLTIEDE
ncbi:hypothetical protein [Mesorhizobium sp. Cs1321R2N1]|uniref:hypothetical protein n=1 Tax=Mesorhizobium sp. Cs1321R2N1 TaxID=3015174 RepID=UPI00301E3386